eukprot:gnl/Hemi2/7997_TR2755_c0_g1_i1.p1 gnl/Hemi2/7997_TR2755_c0_g1~~gnl/Hemi2/7997_TR2755_c0_g1_i1.p1  ORF type:complete len:405 (+),score=144.48 gnl/Hemi2/7997_TR2755_c0_g1_i1:126-1340(+)
MKKYYNQQAVEHVQQRQQLYQQQLPEFLSQQQQLKSAAPPAPASAAPCAPSASSISSCSMPPMMQQLPQQMMQMNLCQDQAFQLQPMQQQRRQQMPSQMPQMQQQQLPSQMQQQQQQQQPQMNLALPSSQVGADAYGNQADSGFDLGQDGAFSDFSVLVGLFGAYLHADWPNTAGAALAKKGFRVTLLGPNDIPKFIAELRSGRHDVAWIQSCQTFHSSPAGTEEDFKAAVLEFHQQKKGLMIWGDNAPLFVHANLVLPTIAGCTLTGDTPAGRILVAGHPNTPGNFDPEHLIFAGIERLYEGVTICYPTPVENAFKTLATSTDGNPCICVMERSEKGGRVVLDTGWTKLYQNFWTTAGQPRYVVNACVWLADIEARFGGDEWGLVASAVAASTTTTTTTTTPA